MRQKIKTMLKTLFLDSFIIKTKPRTVELKNNSAEDQTFTFRIEMCSDDDIFLFISKINIFLAKFYHIMINGERLKISEHGQ